MNDIINKRDRVEWDTEEIKKIPDKKCYLVCSIIILLNTSFVGAMIYLINNEGLNGSIS